jgi:CRP-like cAMP-binding protein
MKLATAAKDTCIFKQGDTGCYFFLIKAGEVDVEIEQEYIRTIGSGQCFGELALIYCTKRTATIKCKSDNLQLILIKSQEFKSVMRSIREKNNERTKSLIENVHIFWFLTAKQKYNMLNSLVREHFKSGTVLFRENDLPVSFYIIESGKVGLSFSDPTKTDISLGPTESFGESVFKANAKR